MRHAAASLALALALLAPAIARATVTQPNGVVMPLDSMNGETQLYTLFAERAETIDYRADGAAMPATFSPLCDFRATLVLNETGSSLAIGWYNADPAATTPPAAGDVHVIVPAGSAVGTAITGADIRTDPSYAGGLVGFALVGAQAHYTEARWNPVCTGCATPGPWIMTVIYRSVVTPNAYYLAFEDGSAGATSSSFNNDGDYNDYVYFLEGLVCSGGGVACDTGMPGVCAAGLTDCTATGTTCRGLSTPSAERCNGLDDNCDGATDEGDGLCAGGSICERGNCVPQCVEGSCFPGEVCTARGVCVESACETMTCAAGMVCVGGVCRGACDGVACPGDQACRAGRCVDPCAGVACDGGRVCTGGACVVSCDCAPCAVGLACESASGQCREPACVGMSCAAGTVCRAGACVDACAGAACPAGQRCETGACVPAPAGSDAGVADSGAGDSGAGDAGGRDAGLDAAAGDAGARDAGARDAGARDGSADVGRGGADPSCGCRTPGGGAPGHGIAALAGVALALAARRRRRPARG